MRYKSVKWNNFEKGEAGQIFSLLSDAKMTNRVRLSDQKKIQLARETEKYVFQLTNYSYPRIHTAGTDQGFVFFRNPADSHAKLYSFAYEDGPEYMSSAYDFGAITGTINEMPKFNSRVIVSYMTSGVAYNKWAYDTIIGTWYDCSGIEAGQNIMDWVVDGDTLYIATSSWQFTDWRKIHLYKSVDGGAFTKILQWRANDIPRIARVGGFLYLRAIHLYRVDKNGGLQLCVSNVSNIIKGFNNKIYYYDDKALKAWNGVEEEIVIKTDIALQPIGIAQKKLWFAYNYNSSIQWIFSLDRNEGLMREFVFTNTDLNRIYSAQLKVVENDTHLIFCGDAPAYAAPNKGIMFNIIPQEGGYGLTFKALGNFTTTKKNLGSFMPVQLIARTIKPVPLNGTIKIWGLENLGDENGDWTTDKDGNPLITLVAGEFVGRYRMRTENSVYGDSLDFISFFVQYETNPTEGGESPELLELELLYLPTGMENAK